jgi:phage terminase small subunit
MIAGRKPKTLAQKKLSNTVQPCRDGVKGVLADVPSRAPAVPEWLSEGAREVWAADLQRAVAMGLAEVDQSMFALYCETMSAFIAGVKTGNVPNAAFRSELRKQMELLGMAGGKSRLTKIAAPEQTAPSPFAPRKKLN